MAFNDLETSNQSGHPVHLYLFKYGLTYWRYCTADSDLTIGLDENDDPAVWLARAVSDGGVTQGGSDQNDLVVSMANNLPIPALFQNRQPSGKVWLTVLRYHIGDPDNETPIDWTGTVVNSVAMDEATVQLNCRSLAGTYDRNGLRLQWDRTCPHDLYGNGCRVNKDDHAYPRTIDTLTGVSFTCTAHTEAEEGSFSGGFVEWVRGDGSFERRAVENQTGNNFVVMGSTAGMEVGMEITIYPGCARDTTTCKLFDNLKNYGGFPHIPGKSPFDGSPVF